MPANEQILASKSTSSVIKIPFDFISLLAPGDVLGSTHSVVVTVYSGIDFTPSVLLSGVTSKSGTVVTQTITGGLVGVIYTLVCSCNTVVGSTLIKVARLAIVPN